MVNLLQALAYLRFGNGRFFHIGKLLQGERIVINAVLRCRAKLQGELFKIAAFHQRTDGVDVNACGVDGLREVCHIEILFAVDLVVFFAEHFGVDDLKGFFFCAYIREKIMYAFRIAEIDDLIAAANGELWQTEVERQRRCGIAGKVGTCRGKLKTRLFGGIDEARNEKRAAEKMVVAFGAAEDILEVFSVLHDDIVNGLEVLAREGIFVDCAYFFCGNRRACDLLKKTGVGFGYLDGLRLEHAGVFVRKRGKTEHSCEHRMTATILAGGFFGKLDFGFTGK